MTDKIILASGSPRRKEILSLFGKPFEVITSDIEEPVVESDPPEITVMALALEKALDVASKAAKGHLVIGADTLVYCEGYLGKPKNEQDAFDMLVRLQGRAHQVYTGVAVIRAGTDEKVVDSVCTTVHMKPLTTEQIRCYVDSGEPMGKAGAYAIQGKGTLLVEEIHGDYFNVVGLPAQRLGEILEKHFGYNLMG